MIKIQYKTSYFGIHIIDKYNNCYFINMQMEIFIIPNQNYLKTSSDL